MGDRLDEVLLKSGLISEEQLATAKADAARTRKRLPETLIDLGMIEERQFARWMAKVSRAPLVDPISEDESAAISHKITRGVGREIEVVPIRIVGEELHVAVTNPLDRSAIDMVAATTGFRVRPFTGVRSVVERLVNRFYPEDYDAADITLLPTQTFEGPISGSEEKPPFEFSNETLMGSVRPLTVAGTPDDSHGTIIAKGVQPPSSSASRAGQQDISTNPTNPFIAVERRFDQLAKMISRIEKRLETIEAALLEPKHR